MPKKAKLVGEVFGRLTVLRESTNKVRGAVTWECCCSCGAKGVLATSRALLSGTKKSCSCLKKGVAEWTKGSRVLTTHGMSKTSTYVCWKNMLARCTDKNHQAYMRYGGAGINVCAAWRSFESFYADMGEKPRDKSLNRIDPRLGYSPENCEWADRKRQALDVKKRKDSSCEFKGVSWDSAMRKYKAAFHAKHLGYSDDALYLALVYDAASIKANGVTNGTNLALGIVDITLEQYLKTN